jgi:hypothetical protein
MLKNFCDEDELMIVSLIIQGKKNSEIKRTVGFKSQANKINLYRRALREDHPRIRAIADSVARDQLKLLQACADELSPRLASMPPGEIVGVMGELLQQLRRAGVRFDLPAGSQGSSDSTPQSKAPDSR